jgi:cyclophilin family peptidyl-prolyl cis-trans isomerase
MFMTACLKSAPLAPVRCASGKVSAPIGLCLLALIAGCVSRGQGAGIEARIQIANLEAKRDGGVASLLELAHGDNRAVQALALRALGRTGGSRAAPALLAALDSDDAELRLHAAAGLGLLVAATTELPTSERARISRGLLAALPRSGARGHVIFEALGRAGDEAAQGALVKGVVSGPLAARRAAALGLGRMGKREMKLDAAARAALCAAASHGDRDLRFAAVWALAREHRPDDAASDPAVRRLLLEAALDDDVEIRATAIAAARGRKLLVSAHGELRDALAHHDWRVVLEGAKALLALEHPIFADDVVAAAARHWDGLRRGNSDASAQVVIEVMRGLPRGHAQSRQFYDRLAVEASTAAVRKLGIAASWMHCLAVWGQVRAAGNLARLPELRRCGSDDFSSHLRGELEVLLLRTGGVGSGADRRALWQSLMGAKDPRVRAVAVTALDVFWEELDGEGRKQAGLVLAAAMIEREATVVGAAAEVVATLVGSHPGEEALAAAVVAATRRAANEADPEVAVALLGLVAADKAPAGRAACAAALAHRSPPVRVAARACLGKDAPVVTTAEATRVVKLPPLDVATVAGKRVTWVVRTTGGELTIELDPLVAPWHVAAIVDLTRKRFYDGLLFHRVVPGFVVQGGDPSGSGWGGPGYTLPAEPGSILDGDRYAFGDVGIADAGKDTGGSQFFVMHSHAPHLEGRYTRVGRVVHGLEVIHRLMIGDRILDAVVTVR